MHIMRKASPRSRERQTQGLERRRSRKVDYDAAGAFNPLDRFSSCARKKYIPELSPPRGLGLAGRELGDLAMSIALTRSGFSIALSGFAVACCFLIGLQVSATTAAPSAGQTSLTINRTLKSDRMPLVPAITRNAVNGPVDECSNGHARPEAPPARRMRADGERHWAVAVGQIARALPFLNWRRSRSAAGSITIAGLHWAHAGPIPGALNHRCFLCLLLSQYRGQSIRNFTALSPPSICHCKIEAPSVEYTTSVLPCLRCGSTSAPAPELAIVRHP